MRTNVVLIPCVEKPVWPSTPLAKIVDVLNYAAAEWNNGKIEGEWKDHVKTFISMNNLDKIASEHPETMGKTFFMGFGGSHFFVHDLTGERAYVIYAPERDDEGKLRY